MLLYTTKWYVLIVIVTVSVSVTGQLRNGTKIPAPLTAKPVVVESSNKAGLALTENEFDVLADSGMLHFFSNSKSDYLVSTYETDAVSARKACSDLAEKIGKPYHLLMIDQDDELSEVREHLAKLTDEDKPVWTTGERNMNATFWNAANNSRLLMPKHLFRSFEEEVKVTTAMPPEDIDGFASLQPLLSRKSRRSLQEGRMTTPKLVIMPFGKRQEEGDSIWEDDCEDGNEPSLPCPPVKCNVTKPICNLKPRPVCLDRVEQNCTVHRPECSAKCENCTVVVPPKCFVEVDKNCSVTQGECEVRPGDCTIEYPKCEVYQPPCESYRPRCYKVTKSVSCTTREPCIGDCDKCPDSNCKDCKCKVSICQEEETICPSPITHCPPPIVVCPEPIVNCSDKPEIKCPEPDVKCDKPKVTCTEAQVVCSSPVVTCPIIVSKCDHPGIVCPPPDSDCGDADIDCPTPEPCPEPPTSPRPCCVPCGCSLVSRNSKLLEFQKCRRQNRFVCEAPKIFNVDMKKRSI